MTLTGGVEAAAVDKSLLLARTRNNDWSCPPGIKRKWKHNISDMNKCGIPDFITDWVFPKDTISNKILVYSTAKKLAVSFKSQLSTWSSIQDSHAFPVSRIKAQPLRIELRITSRKTRENELITWLTYLLINNIKCSINETSPNNRNQIWILTKHWCKNSFTSYRRKLYV